MGNKTSMEIPQVMKPGQKPDPPLFDSEIFMIKDIITDINQQINTVNKEDKEIVLSSSYLDSKPSAQVMLCLSQRFEAVGYKVELIDDVWPDTPGYGTPRWYVRVEKEQ